MEPLRTSEDMLIDFDGWLGRQDDATRNGVQQHLNQVPKENLSLEKQRFASVFAVAAMYGKDPKAVDEQWDNVRGGFAEQKGGDWLAVKDDEPGFHGQLKKTAIDQREERQMVFGPDEDAPRAGVDGSAPLVDRVHDAAIAGKSYADAMGEWQATLPSDKKWVSERAAQHADIARKEYARISELVAKVKPVATQVFDEISKARGTQEGEGDKAPFALLRGLSVDEKSMVFRLMTDRAGDAKAKDFYTKVLPNALGRGYENWATGGSNAALISDLMELHFTEGQKVFGPVADPLTFLQLKNNATDKATINLDIGSRTLSAKEAEDWNRQVQEKLEDTRTSEQLRRFGQNVIDSNDKSGTWAQRKIIKPVADSAALMSTMMIPGAWVGALKQSASSYAGDTYFELKAKGVEDAEAMKIAQASGFAEALLDKAEVGLLRGIPGTKQVLEKFTLSGGRVARFLVNTAGTTMSETAIELTQDHIIPALMQDNLTSDPNFDVHWGDVWAETAKAAPDTALGMILLSGAGGIFQTRAQTKFVQEFSTSGAAMRARGYSMEQIDEIQAAPMEQRGDLLAQYLPSKAPVGAEQSALVADVVKLAEKERATAAEKIKAEQGATAEAADYAINVTRSEAGWQVTQNDGAKITVDSAEAARRIREDLRQASTEQEAAALVAIVDNWHANAPEGTKRETALTGETVQSDGQSVTRTRDGKVREVTNAASMEAIRNEAKMDGGDAAIEVLVNGSNAVEFAESVVGAARETAQRLELNQSESTALTAIHEQVEATWRTGVAKGTITLEETQAAVAAVSTALDPAKARTPQEKAFRERVQRVAEGKASETEVRETVSELAVAEVIGRRKDGETMPAGAVTTALDTALMNATDAAEVKALGKFRAMLRALRRWFRGVFGTVAALQKNKREGKSANFDALVDKLLGRTEQAAHDKASIEQVEKSAKEAGVETTKEKDTHSITSGDRVELVMKRLDAALEKQPEKRRILAQEANIKLQDLAFRWSYQNPIVEKRSVASLDKEEAFREAARVDELEKSGIEKKKAKQQAREETFEWRREQDEAQQRDWNPKASMVRDLQTYNAILMAMPPEIRGKMGGFVKLAQLGEKGRTKEISKRIEKLSGLVEKHLQKETVEAMGALIEKAQPNGGPGERPGGKITVAGHRVFAETERVWKMSEKEVAGERDTLSKAIEKQTENAQPGVTDSAMTDLLEREQILDMFGDFKSKTAAEMDAAFQWLNDVYRTGRNAWRAIEEQRAAEVAFMQQMVMDAMGAQSGSLAARQAQKVAETKISAMLENGSLDLLSFVQVLENFLAPGHPLVKRWNLAAREATAQKTDAILAATGRFDKAARAAFGGTAMLETQRRLWAMATEQKISIDKREGGSRETIEVPREKVEQFRDGLIDAATFGISTQEASDLVAELDNPDNAKRKNLSVERVNTGDAVPAKITEAEAIGLTLLARQEQYAKNFERHGYTKAVLAQTEAGISDAGKKLREFFANEYRDGYAPLARVFREMFGIDLPQITNYSPAPFEHAGKTRDVDPFGGGLLADGGFRAGFLKDRKSHLAEPRVENALSVWRGHVSQTEHWRAFAPLVRELKSVLGAVAVKNAVSGKHGSEMNGALQRWVQSYEQNGLHERTLGRAADAIGREITRRQATLTLAYNAGSILKQSLAKLTSATRMPLGAWMRGFVRVASGKVDVKAIRESAMIQRRIQTGYSPEVRSAMTTLFSGKPTAWKNFLARGLEALGEVDGYFTASGTAIVFDYHLNEGLKAGLSQEDATKRALVEAEDNIGRTAQPTEMMDRSLMELGMSPLERVGFMFASNQRKDTAILISGFQQWKAGKISKGELAKIMSVAWLATGIGSALIGAAWRDAKDDDDDEWLDWEHWNPKDIALQSLLGPLGGIPILNFIPSWAQGFSSSGPFQPVARAVNSAEDIFDGDKTEPVEKTVKRTVDILNGAAMLTEKAEALAVAGNIFKQVFNLVDNFTPDTEAETDAKEKRARARAQKEAREE